MWDGFGVSGSIDIPACFYRHSSVFFQYPKSGTGGVHHTDSRLDEQGSIH